LGNYLIDGEYYKSLPAAQQEKERNRGINELKKSISIYPFSESYFSLGIVYYLKQEYDSSLYYYHEAIRQAPYIAKYHNNMATVFFEMKQLDKALAECQVAVQHDPYYTDAWNNMASVYGAMNQLDQAMVNFQKTLSIDPNNARANYFIGKILQNSGKPEEQVRAQSYLDKAAALDPQYK
jgi:tetratricopeptide (TPR) repeat protein